MRLVYYTILFFIPVCLFGQADFFGQQKEANKDELTQIEVEFQLTVYPNPTVDYLNIATNTPFSGTYMLTNIIGKQLTTGVLIKDQATEVMMGEYNDGIYLLNVFDENGKRITTRKIFKE
jgi:hypothetical protein